MAKQPCLILALAATFLWCGQILAATDNGIEVNLVAKNFDEIKPAQLVTVSYLIKNPSDNPVALTDSIELPPGWRTITSMGVPFQLGPGDEVSKIITLLPSTTTTAGGYNITYAVAGTRDPSVRASVSMSTAIATVVKVETIIEEKPDLVAAGQSFSTRVLVTNRSNCPIDVAAIAKSTSHYLTIVEPMALRLQPGETRPVNITVDTDPKLRHSGKHITYFKLDVTGEHFAQVTKDRYIAVDIVPRVSIDRDPFNMLAARLNFAGMFDEIDRVRHSAWQIEFTANGFLDEEMTKRVDMLLRGPDIATKVARNGSADEYHLTYTDPRVSFSLGDIAHHLSPLVESGFFGRGVDVQKTIGQDTRAGSFFATKIGDSRERELGSFISHRFENGLDVRLNYLQKYSVVGTDESLRGDNIIGISSTYSYHNAYRGEFETGIDVNGNAGGCANLAWRAMIQSTESLDKNPVSFALQRVHAHPEFYGSYSNVDTSMGNISFPVFRDLRGIASFRLYQDNLDQNRALGTSATDEKFYSAGLLYPISKSTGITVTLDYLSRKDRISPIDFSYDQRTAKLEFRHRFSYLSFAAGAAFGSFHDLRNRLSTNALAIFILSGMATTPFGTYSIHGQTGSSSLASTNPDNSVALGASASWAISKQLRLNLAYDEVTANTNTKIGRFSVRTYCEQERVTANASYAFKDGSLLSLNGAYSKVYEGSEEKSLLATFTRPFRIPVTRRTTLGSLEGRVFMIKPDGTKEAVRQAIISIQTSATLSDEKGRYRFASVQPGKYMVVVDKKSMGTGRVTAKRFPVGVEIKGGQTTVLDIETVPPARISGKATLFALEDRECDGPDQAGPADAVVVERGPKSDTAASRCGTELKPVRALSGVVFEVDTGDEFIQRISDSGGVFEFEDLRPGTAHLVVDQTSLPKQHESNIKEMTIEGQSGEVIVLQVEVKPKTRKIQFLEKGGSVPVKRRESGAKETARK